MTHLKKTRTLAYVVTFGVAAAGLLASAPDDAQAQGRRRRAAVVINLQTPLGLQGTRGAGDNVIIPFSLQDRSRRATNVEVQYGVDLNDDGIIYPGDSEVDVSQRTGQDAEYLAASEDRLAPENTRKNRRPQLFSTAARVGAAHAYAWRSSSDIESSAFPTSQFQFTPDGRPIEDPNNPGSFLFAPTQPGVKVRVRAVRGKGRRRSAGQWAYTDAFALNNNTPPALTIDEVVIPDPLASPPVQPNEIVEIKWSAFDDNSEDLDGDGEFDPIDGEDLNGNNLLDNEYVAAAFDYYELQPGDTPQAMTLEELAGLDWKPCTNADPDGNPDAVRDAQNEIIFDGFASAPTGVSGVGNQHTFRWLSVVDVGTINGDFIVRARPFDQKREHGLYEYEQTPFTVDNWKIFNSADPDALGDPGASDLAGPRVGHTVTSLTTVLAPPFGNVAGGRTDPGVASPKLAFLVAGGATSVDGPGTTDAVLYRAGTAEAPTTTAAQDSRAIAFNAARSYHTATLLDDGRVLFTGGLSAAGTPLTSTEIYDPIDHEITLGAPMNVARAKHTAVRLASGDVAIFGGITVGGGALNSVEIFRFEPYPGTGGFDLLTNPGQTMAVAQHSVHAVVLPDQHVLVAGGVDAAGNAVTVAEHMDMLNDQNFDGLNDPATKDPVFESVGSMLAARLGGRATRLISGDVLFSGGAGVSSLEVFNHELHQFEPVDVAMEDGARSQHVAVRMGDDSILLAGGITNPTSGAIVPSADLFQLGAYTPGSPVGTWTGSFLRVNGDMVTPRRLAAASALINGKVIIAGGEDGSATLSSLETFTPDNAINRLPTASVELQSDQQSWAFGAPVQYRLVDPEGDRAFVTVQYSSDSQVNWTAASPQASTIGGDVAEGDSDLITATTNDGSAIDPIGRVEDHLYIWGMSQDLVRPAMGTSVPGFNVRVIPFGALQGNLGISAPITVLSNTKVIPTIYPLADRNGVDDPNRGGDIEIWVHLRDIDGPAVPPGTTKDPRPGELVQTTTFEYAIDATGPGGVPDGQIRSEDGEFWVAMTPVGAGSAAIRAITGAKAPDDLPNPDGGKFDGKNVLENLESYSEAPGDTNDIHPLLPGGGRTAGEGWHKFDWDSVYDLDAPATTRDNIWMRVIPKDADIGFTATLRNEPGVTKFINVRDMDAIWLDSFTPKGGNPTSVKPNEPIDLLFNGHVHPDSVNASTLLATSNGSDVLGEYTVVQNPDFTTLITFWPLGQSTVDDVNVYDPGDPVTVQQPGMNITITLTGYMGGQEPDLAPTVPTLVPDNGAYVDGTLAYPGPVTQTSTYLLVQNVQTSVSYDVVAGNHDDSVSGTLGSSVPIDGATIPGAAPEDPITLTVDKAIDHTTVKSPNIQVFVDSGGGVDSVVPGRWTVTNEQVLSPDKTTLTTNSILTFTPFIQYPSGTTIKIQANSGLLTEAGNPVQNGGFSPSADGFATTYSITAYGTTGDTITEDFTSTVNQDTTIADKASWGDDPCNPDKLTGLQIAPLSGGSNLTVGKGQVSTITQASVEYDNLTVEKGGILRIRVPGGPSTIRARTMTIRGTVDLRGEDGWSGGHGNTANTSVTTGPTRNHGTGLRAGGVGRNGAGSGGASRNHASSNRTRAGDAGVGIGRGGGGGVTSASGRYWYGAAGGGGAGFGNRGFTGGKSWSSGNAGGTGGTTYGTADFSGGPVAGSGGGGGGTQKQSSNTHQGGGGGAGGGMVTLECIGDFLLAPSGLIDGRGGDGGAKHFYGGAGGAGSGGGVLIRAGTRATLDGVVDLRGGQGGPPGVGYYSDFYANSTFSTQGTHRRGGDGGGGRLAVFAPNLLGADTIRVKGQFMSRKVTSVPSGPGGASNQPSAFTNGTPNEDQPYRPTGSTLHLNSMTIASGKTVDIVSGTTSQPLTIYVDGDINIDGTLTLNGQVPTYGYDPGSSASSGVQIDGGGGFQFRPNTTARNGFGPSTLGSGAGARGLNNSGASLYEGFDAVGAGGGKHKLKKTGTPLKDTRGWNMYYYTGDAGGGGGGAATPGDDGWAPYAAPPKYNYFGAINDTSNKGVSSDVRRGISGANAVENNALKHGGPGGDQTDITNVSLSNFGTFAGSGGGGGNSGGFNNWSSYRYYGYAGHAGSGAGALALVAKGNVNINGTIEAIGGGGNPPGNTLRSANSNFNWSVYAHSGGGAGSGGFVYVMGQNVNIDPASGSGSGSGGATVDLGGGIGGGVRGTTEVGSIDEKYPSYYSYGAFGGNGGFGRMVVDYVGELNGANTPVFNKYGNQESDFGDSIKARYTALGGTATSGCLFSGGASFRSQWYDLNSVAPLVSALNLSGVGGTPPTIFGQGAQSHPHAVGRAADGPEPWRTVAHGYRRAGPDQYQRPDEPLLRDPAGLPVVQVHRDDEQADPHLARAGGGRDRHRVHQG
jgi:hypothetical protein